MSKKRKLLIDTSLDLFYSNSINSIGINEILKTSGVAKQTLYSHFESKESLILSALQQRHTNFIEWLKTKLDGVDSNEQLIIRLFNALESWFRNSESMLGDFHGCFFINSASEFNNKQSNISLFCKQHKHEVRETIKQYMSQENLFLLDAICIMKEGAITNAYVSGDYSSAIKCIRILKQYENNTAFTD
ncbi:TetR/AcrR family transcriptional regulator [Psychromonas sp. B3M02]|uniref:TetR/AcrR family transcriptional regulator n=1 Tax=Psychromonas sp. B3M02 TaxID=2267226 RepID=UPI000DE892CD|nr:TetR/AcrR family transcriptional regulator [Psychromonas sp. B3M02]RBW41366.1 TetR/AcrR family transcriptional regulator [Psychromonas sp. B3M02]